MRAKLRLLTILSFAVLASACGKDDSKKTDTATEPAPTPASVPATQAASESTPALQEAAPEPAAKPAPATADFDVNAIPISNKDIGEFPFFTPPEGYKYNSSDSKFTRYYYPISEESIHPVEGKGLGTRILGPDEVLLIQRNYENAITAAGGIKVFEGQVDYEKTYGTLSNQDRRLYGSTGSSGDVQQVYLIRKQDMEVWFEVACSSICYFTVTQKEEMKQSVNRIPLSQMKQE